jgi:hypothetical protein
MSPEELLINTPENISKTAQFEAIRGDYRGQGLLVAVQRFETDEFGQMVASYEVYTEEQPVENISGLGPLGEGTRPRFVTEDKPVQVTKDIGGYGHSYIVQNKDGQPDIRSDSKRLRKKLHKQGKHVINIFSNEGIVHL